MIFRLRDYSSNVVGRWNGASARIASADTVPCAVYSWIPTLPQSHVSNVSDAHFSDEERMWTTLTLLLWGAMRSTDGSLHRNSSNWKAYKVYCSDTATPEQTARRQSACTREHVHASCSSGECELCGDSTHTTLAAHIMPNESRAETHHEPPCRSRLVNPWNVNVARIVTANHIPDMFV